MFQRFIRGFLVVCLLCGFIFFQPVSANAAQNSEINRQTLRNAGENSTSSTENMYIPANSDLFEPYVYLGVGSQGLAVDTGDFNKDGFTDIAFTAQEISSNLYYLYVNWQSDTGDGTFQQQRLPAGFTPLAISVGDMNNDGWDDIVTAEKWDNTVSIYYQNPGVNEVSERQIISTPSQPVSLACGDFNGDTREDLAVGFMGFEFVRVYYQDELGLNTIKDFPATAHARDLEAGNRNNDGLTDLLVVMYETSGMLFYTQDGLGGFENPTGYNARNNLFGNAALGDVNSDGNSDIVVAVNGLSQNLAVSNLNSDGVSINGAIYSEFNLPGSVEIGDLNQDDRMDVIIPHSSAGTLSVFFQLPSGRLAPHENYPIPLSSDLVNNMALGDLNHDGLLDVVVTTERGAGVAILYHKAPTFNISSSPLTRLARPGEIVQFVVNIVPSSGFSQPVDLVMDGLPEGSSVVWVTSPAQWPGYYATATVTISAAVPYGSYPLTISGNEGGILNQTQVMLQVVDPKFVFLPMLSNDKTVLYSDNFQDSQSGWPDADTWDWGYHYISGEYMITINPSYTGVWVTAGHTAENFNASVSVESDSAVDAALIFGIRDDDKEYFGFRINRLNQYWYLDHWDGSILTTLYWGVSPAIIQGGYWNKLGVTRIGSNIKLYANNQLIKTIELETYTGARKIGLAGYSLGGSFYSAYFSDYVVTLP